MILKKEVTIAGYCLMWIDDIPCTNALSNELTGTTSADFAGVFSECAGVNFSFGDFERRFVFEEIPLRVLPVHHLAEIYSARISAVREWVSDCIQTGGTEVLFSPGEGAL